MKWYKDPKFIVGDVAIPVVLAAIGWVYTNPSNHMVAASNNQGIITEGQTGGTNTANPILRERLTHPLIFLET